MDLREYLRILKRRKNIFLAVSLLVILGYATGVWLRSSVYQASAVYMYKQKEYTQQLLGTLVTPPSISLATQLRLVHGIGILDKVYGRLEQLKERYDELKDKSKAFQFLKQHVSVDQVGEADLVRITATARDPKLVKEIANAYVQVLVQEINSLLNEELSKAESFLLSKVEEQEDNLSVLRQRRQAFLKKHGLVGMDIDLQIVTQKLASLNTQIEEAKLRLQRQKMWQEALKSRLASVPAFLSSEAIEQNPQYASYQQNLLSLRMQLLDLKEKYTDNHPAVQQLKKKIERLRSEIQTKIARNIVVERDLPNPLHASLQERLLGAQMEQLDASLSQQLYAKLYQKEKEHLRQLTATQSEYAEIEHKLLSAESFLRNLKDTLEKVRLSRFLGQEGAKIYELASSATPLYKMSKPSAALVFVLALIMGLAASFVSEVLDERVRSSHTCKKVLGVPVLGVIPTGSEPEKLGDEAILREGFRTAAFHLRKEAERLNSKSILVTSLHPQEGKTTLALFIAQVMASEVRKVLLVDGDLRKSKIHKLLQIENIPGLTDFLSGKLEAQKAVEQLKEKEVSQDAKLLPPEIIRPTSWPGLSVITSGSHVSSPADFISRSEGVLLELLQVVKKEFDFIFVDSPPFLPVVDSTIYASLCDAVVLIVDSHSTYKRDLTSFRSLTSTMKFKLLGAILNRVRKDHEDYYYYYYTSYYRTRKT